MIHMENRNTETIKMMYLEDRPYEKCEQYGAEHLTDVELLAVLLRTGTKGENSLRLAQKILHPPFGSEGLLSVPQWSMEQLLKIKGIGKVKSIQILCLDFSSPDSIARYYMEDLRHKKREVMKLLLLNTRSRLISEMDVSTGTINSTLVSPRELFVEALQKNAVSIILLHNHPSGDPTPSKEDLLTTRRIREAGALIGIELLDHIIIGDNCYFSLREKGFFSQESANR